MVHTHREIVSCQSSLPGSEKAKSKRDASGRCRRHRLRRRRRSLQPLLEVDGRGERPPPSVHVKLCLLLQTEWCASLQCGVPFSISLSFLSAWQPAMRGSCNATGTSSNTDSTGSRQASPMEVPQSQNALHSVTEPVRPSTVNAAGQVSLLPVAFRLLLASTYCPNSRGCVYA